MQLDDRENILKTLQIKNCINKYKQIYKEKVIEGYKFDSINDDDLLKEIKLLINRISNNEGCDESLRETIIGKLLLASCLFDEPTKLIEIVDDKKFDIMNEYKKVYYIK